METSYLLKLCTSLFELKENESDKEIAALFRNLPLSVYWKDKEGVYLGQNDFATELQIKENFADKKDTSIVGKIDHDLFGSINAERFRSNDLIIIENPFEIHHPFLENTLTHDGRDLLQLSLKKPLFSKKKQVIGVIGCTIPVYLYDTLRILDVKKDVQSNNLKGLIIKALESKNLEIITDVCGFLRLICSCQKTNKYFEQIPKLSDRELQCLFFLARGCSAKEIGQLMEISARTVEIFINKLKEKLNLGFKSQLNDWIWNMIGGL